MAEPELLTYVLSIECDTTAERATHAAYILTCPAAQYKQHASAAASHSPDPLPHRHTLAPHNTSRRTSRDGCTSHSPATQAAPLPSRPIRSLARYLLCSRLHVMMARLLHVDAEALIRQPALPLDHIGHVLLRR